MSIISLLFLGWCWSCHESYTWADQASEWWRSGSGWTSSHDGSPVVQEGGQSTCNNELPPDGCRPGQGHEQHLWLGDHSLCCRNPTQPLTSSTGSAGHFQVWRNPCTRQAAEVKTCFLNTPPLKISWSTFYQNSNIKVDFVFVASLNNVSVNDHLK